MDNNIKPSTIMLIAGGAVLLLSSFLDWFSVSSGGFSIGASGWEIDGFGLHGIIVALIGLAVGGGVALTTFANVSMPERILGFNHDQLHLILGFSAFLITFGLQFREGAAIGVLLGWIASAVIVAGAYMDMQAAGGDAPPTQF